jgi:NADH-quinone oxidoreductase subunit J
MIPSGFFLSTFWFCFYVISSRNPIHSILSLICVFLLSSFLLLCLEAEFLALSYVIIYVGAIAILFLFVVMLLDIKVPDKSLPLLKQTIFAYVLSFMFFLELILPLFLLMDPSIENSSIHFLFIDWFSEANSFSNIISLGITLYTYYFVFFLIAGFILLIAVFGVLMLLITPNKNFSAKNVSVIKRKFRPTPLF